MKVRKNITKKLLIKIGLFAILIGATVLFDTYFEKNDVILDEIQAESNQDSNELRFLHFVTQTNVISIKSTGEKIYCRKAQVNAQDKHIQKYHQLRNYQVLKAEGKQELLAPQVLSYQYLGFKNYHFTQADDDDPVIS